MALESLNLLSLACKCPRTSAERYSHIDANQEMLNGKNPYRIQDVVNLDLPP